MSNNERANQWQNHIDQWHTSGISGARFCKQHKLDLAQFYYWKNKSLAKPVKASKNQKHPIGFAAVVVTDSPAIEEQLSFTLPNGCAIFGITNANVLLVGVILGQL